MVLMICRPNLMSLSVPGRRKSESRLEKHRRHPSNSEAECEYSANPSPEGRGWPEGPGEGAEKEAFYCTPHAGAPSLMSRPLPSVEGIVPKHFEIWPIHAVKMGTEIKLVRSMSPV
jgi:hypothetical protein